MQFFTVSELEEQQMINPSPLCLKIEQVTQDYYNEDVDEFIGDAIMKEITDDIKDYSVTFNDVVNIIKILNNCYIQHHQDYNENPILGYFRQFKPHIDFINNIVPVELLYRCSNLFHKILQECIDRSINYLFEIATQDYNPELYPCEKIDRVVNYFLQNQLNPLTQDELNELGFSFLISSTIDAFEDLYVINITRSKFQSKWIADLVTFNSPIIYYLRDNINEFKSDIIRESLSLSIIRDKIPKEDLSKYLKKQHQYEMIFRLVSYGNLQPLDMEALDTIAKAKTELMYGGMSDETYNDIDHIYGEFSTNDFAKLFRDHLLEDVDFNVDIEMVRELFRDIQKKPKAEITATELDRILGIIERLRQIVNNLIELIRLDCETFVLK